MSSYLFPIFAFGLVITGIVFLGVQQAADLAKQLSVQQNRERAEAKERAALPSRGKTPLTQPRPTASRT